MPKIIENLRQNLLRETRRMLLEVGYKGLSVRQIACNCQTAVGTVYNYFPSKEMLVANVLLEDWLAQMETANRQAQAAESAEQGMAAVYAQILMFTDRYRKFFHESTLPLGSSAYEQRHFQLRGQIQAVLEPLLERFGGDTSPVTLTLVTECLLTATAENWTFEELYPSLKKLTEQERTL